MTSSKRKATHQTSSRTVCYVMSGELIEVYLYTDGSVAAIDLEAEILANCVINGK